MELDECPEWLKTQLISHEDAIGVLIGNVEALRFGLQVLIETHPEPHVLRSRWHAGKPELVEQLTSHALIERWPEARCSLLSALGLIDVAIQRRCGPR